MEFYDGVSFFVSLFSFHHIIFPIVVINRGQERYHSAVSQVDVGCDDV